MTAAYDLPKADAGEAIPAGLQSQSEFEPVPLGSYRSKMELSFDPASSTGEPGATDLRTIFIGCNIQRLDNVC